MQRAARVGSTARSRDQAAVRSVQHVWACSTARSRDEAAVRGVQHVCMV